MRALASLAWALSLAAALSLLGGCRPAAVPQVPAPSGDSIEDLDALVAVGRVVSGIGRAVCAQLDQASPCHGVLDGLDDGLAVAGAALTSAQACREQFDQACVDQAIQTARDHLPELQRLVRAALGAAGAR